jgi:glutamate-1-semialdehyde aminotransferase
MDHLLECSGSPHSGLDIVRAEGAALFEPHAVRPDIVALEKGLGNGYPVSAAAVTAGVARDLEAGRLRYAQSHQNDLLVIGEEDVGALLVCLDDLLEEAP